MEILRRRPGVGYYGTHLWLPKTHVAESQLRGSLVYELGVNKADIEAWSEERHHYIVPRNYISLESLSRLPFPVIDARLRSFPYVEIRSKVVLDSRDPSKSYQREGSAALLSNYDGILCLRCGAGKTVTGFHTATLLNVPILVVVTDKGLAEQWKEEILEFTDLEEEDIGFIGDGKFVWKRKVTIAIVNTLASRASAGTLPTELVEWFGVLLIDECHVMGAPYFNQAIPPFHGRRWGLSATPHRSDIFESLLRYTVGNVVYTFLEPELIPQVFFRKLPTRINLLDPTVAKAVLDKGNEVHLKKLYSYLATRDDRVNTIVREVKAAIKNGRQVLILSQSRALVERLGEKFPEGGVCHGGITDKKERLRRIRECNPVIAIDRLGRQALNKPKLDTLMLCEPFSDMNVIQQIMGRVQRFYDGKQEPMFVVYDDVFLNHIHEICLKIRQLLSRWPKHMGGRIPFKNVG